MDIIKGGLLSLVLITSTPYTAEYVALPVEEIIPLEEVKPVDMQLLVEYYANEYGVSTKMMKWVVKCESGFNPNAVNMLDSHKLSQGSHGVAQFSRETFAQYAKEMGKDWTDPYNPDEALEVMAYMMSTNQGRHWTCFRKYNQ